MVNEEIPNHEWQNASDENKRSKHFDNLVSETRKEIEELREVDAEYQSSLLDVLNERKSLRQKNTYNENKHSKHSDNLLSETGKEIEELCEVDAEYRSSLLDVLNEKERLRSKKRQSVHSCSEIERDDYHPSKAVVDPQYELYFEHLKKQEKVRALENAKEGLPEDMGPEEELHLRKQDEIHNLEHGKEGLHEATGRRKRNHRDIDLRYGLYLEKKCCALKNVKEGLSVYQESEVSDEPVNLNYRKKLRSYTYGLFHHIENHRELGQNPVSSKRVENTSLMRRKNKDKGKKAENLKCLTVPVSPNPELGLIANVSKSGLRVLRRGGGEKSDCKKKSREISPNQGQRFDGFRDLGSKRYLRSHAKLDGVSRLLHGTDNYNKHYKKPESSERVKILRTRKTDNDAKGTVIDDGVGFMNGGVTVKLEREDEDGYDDVEILDRTAFNKMIEVSPIPMACESTPMELSFRQQVISLFKKPYDEEERKELLLAVTQHKAKDVHKDLRGTGSIKFYKTGEEGKSYLDHYPDFNRKLVLHRNNDRRCLNLLRGFFFWLQNSTQHRSFKPWRDLQCLKTYPDSS